MASLFRFTLCVVPLFLGCAQAENLQEAIIKDMMPASSSKCENQPASSSFTFESSQAESQWYTPFVNYEQHVFLAKMAHADANTNRSWTLRLGRAGNIYSLVGPMGETVPPQAHANAPWVDEVWQNVAPLGPGGNNDGDTSTDKFFIHEAGTYTKDAPYTDIPFYSPTAGSYCDDPNGECGFVSWGQQAHLPTQWKSQMLYLNRYINCGNGVFEYTTLRHRNVGPDQPGEPYNYLNVPWGGTRHSVLKDVVMTSKSTNSQDLIHPLPPWGSSEIRSLSQTLGYTIFAEDLPKGQGSNHDKPYSDLPSASQLDLTIASQCQEESTRYRCQLVSQPSAIGWAPNVGDPGLIVRLEGSNSKTSIVAGIRHWAGNGRLYFYKNSDLTLQKVRQALTVGHKVNVYHWEPPEDGKSEEDNLALTHVHGGQNSNPNSHYPRVRAGGTGTTRDYNVYTINSNPTIRSGDSYFYRQYFVMASYPDMATSGPHWASEAYDGKYAAGSNGYPGRTVSLYSDNGASNRFGFTIGGDDCRPSSATKICEGTTTPRSNAKALFQIQCGTQYVVTDDLYYFSPSHAEGSTVRAYVCNGLGVHDRPTWTLLGYFRTSECSAIKETVENEQYIYDDQYCLSTSSPSVAPTVSVTIPEDASVGGGASGDPHIQTWSGNLFDFQGECDLILTKSPSFANNLGLEIHIRTVMMKKWSYVGAVAVKIGNDIFEVQSGAAYSLNRVENAGLPGTISGFPVTLKNFDTKRARFDIDLGNKGTIVIKVYNEFLAVAVHNPSAEDFRDSVGLMGTFGSGTLLGRDGTTLFRDTNLFGLEWQVRDDEPVLFQEQVGPQFPTTCNLPEASAMSRRRRRLAEQEGPITLDEAEKACVAWPAENREFCISDVLSTGDLGMADAGLF